MTIELLIAMMLAAFLGDLPVHFLNERWRKEINDAEDGAARDIEDRFSLIARQLGMVERALYVVAFYVGHLEFIGAWLVFKVAVHWSIWKNTEPRIDICAGSRDQRKKEILARARFNNFVLGTALSLLITAIIVLLL